MLTIIAFVCCKKFWKSRENHLNLELVDDQLYRNTNFLTLNATQLINAYNANGLPIQQDAIRTDAIRTDAIQSSTPTSSTNALPQTILSPSIHTNGLNNNSLPGAIVSSSINSYSPSNLYTSTNSNQPYASINQQQSMNTSINTNFNGQSSIAMTGYSVHSQNGHPQTLQQTLIPVFYEPPPPYSNSINSNMEISRNEAQITSNTNNQITTTQSVTTANHSSTSNIDSNSISLIPNQTASGSYQSTTNHLQNDCPSNTNNNLQTNNIWSQRLLLALGNYRRDSVFPVLDQPRKKLCRTLSQ